MTMKANPKTLEFRFERVIPAAPEEVFDAWLNPKIPGNPWNAAEKLLLDPREDGLFYWALRGTPHYGRFTVMERPKRIQHTWMSPNTLGRESVVNLTFESRGGETHLVLVHSELPDHELAQGHEKGWNYFLDIFPGRFVAPRALGPDSSS
jgi:uncharacterized protein YndB with AHSA1/START domain